MEIVMLTNGLCAKSRAILERLSELGIEPCVIDISEQADEAARFGARFPDGKPHSPGLVIADRAWRNPSVADVEKLLARAGAVARRPIHFPEQQRIVWHMQPRDAFASYSMRNEGPLVFGHIETPTELRGTGLAAKLALELFDWLEQNGVDARLTCSFLRKVAASDPKWTSRFLDRGRQENHT